MFFGVSALILFEGGLIFKGDSFFLGESLFLKVAKGWFQFGRTETNSVQVYKKVFFLYGSKTKN